MEVNSNTPPFPDSLLIDVNVLLPLTFRYPPFTVISALSVVEYLALHLNIISFKLSVPFDVTLIKVHPESNRFVIAIVKLMSESLSELCEIQFSSPPLTLPITYSLSIPQYADIVNVPFELIPLSNMCVSFCRTIIVPPDVLFM